MPYFLEKIESNKELKKSHVLIGEVHNSSEKKGIFPYIFKALLIFVASYSSVMGLLDAFSVPCQKNVVFFFFLAFSFLMSFMYINKIFFYIGYVVVFLGFAIELARYFFYANSGFQAVVNIIYEKYSDYFELSSVRQAQELYTNRQVTVTFAAIFVGLFLIILLNITISGYMNVIETFFITFPFLEIAFYIGKKPPLIYTSLLLFVYVTVTLLQASRYSRTQVKGKHTHEFARLKRKNKQYYFYQSNSKIILLSLCVAAAFTIVISAVFSGFYYKETSRKPQNAIHRQTDEYLKIFIQTGISGLLNGYSSTGGLSGGRLGGISQVRPDFETDLTVTYAPINYQTVYLKGFTGSFYSGDYWSDYSVSYDENGEQKHLLSYEEIESIETQRKDIFSNKGKIRIENVDANSKFLYRPYYTNTNSSVNKEAVSAYFADPLNAYELTYTPALSQKSYGQDLKDSLLENEEYKTYVYSDCLYVPNDLKPVLDDVISELNVENADNEKDYRFNAADAVYNYFYENFYYTMSPGSTPIKEDFVAYFLTDQKRGYCAHFASASVLLLREMGVPARYCEGYCIPLTLISENAVLTDYDYNDWYEGENITGTESVITVDVNDSYAHAWIEIYIDGYGFVPLEATIPSFEGESQAGFDLTSLFSSLMPSPPDINATGDNVSGDDYYAEDLFKNSIFTSLTNLKYASVTNMAIIVLLSVTVIILLILFAKWITIRIKLMIYKIRGNEYKIVKYEYDSLILKLQKKKYIVKKNPLMSDVRVAYEKYLEEYNSTHKKAKNVDVDELFSNYERILYS